MIATPIATMLDDITSNKKGEMHERGGGGCKEEPKVILAQGVMKKSANELSGMNQH